MSCATSGYVLISRRGRRWFDSVVEGRGIHSQNSLRDIHLVFDMLTVFSQVSISGVLL